MLLIYKKILEGCLQQQMSGSGRRARYIETNGFNISDGPRSIVFISPVKVFKAHGSSEDVKLVLSS